MLESICELEEFEIVDTPALDNDKTFFNVCVQLPNHMLPIST